MLLEVLEKELQSNAPAVEETNSSIGYLSAFDSDGFTVQGSSGGDKLMVHITMFLGTGKQMVLEYQTQMALLHLL
jgi:hypothetical protein